MRKALGWLVCIITLWTPLRAAHAAPGIQCVQAQDGYISVDGLRNDWRDVSAQRYLYWLAYACDYIADYYDSGEGIQWGDTVSGQSLEDYAKDQALQPLIVESFAVSVIESVEKLDRRARHVGCFDGLQSCFCEQPCGAGM